MAIATLEELDRERPAPGQRRTRRPARSAFARIVPGGVAGIGLSYLVLVPLAFLLWSSFTTNGLPQSGSLTLQHWTTVYGDANTYRLILKTLEFAGGSAAVAMVLGTTLTWLVERSDMPGRRLLRIFMLLPMAMPPVLVAIGWVLLAGPSIGPYNTIAKFLGLASIFKVFSLQGMIFVLGISVMPTTYLILGPAFRNVDPSYEEAALAVGASPFYAFRRILLPVLLPALLSTFSYVFILAATVFDIPGILGTPSGTYVLSSQVYADLNPPAGFPDYGNVSALAMVFVVLLLAVSLFYRHQTRRAERFVTVTGRGWSRRRTKLRRWRIPAMIFAGLYSLGAVVAPLAILLYTSLLPYYRGFSFSMFSKLTWHNHAVLADSIGLRHAAEHSVIIAIVAASAVVVLSAAISWLVIRLKVPGGRALDWLAFLPLAIPGIMIGLALIYVYLTVHTFHLYATIWIIVIAVVTTSLAFGTRVTNSVLMQMHPELEEAARVSGAGHGRVFRRVTFPLLRPALFGVWIWVASSSLQNLSSALVLQGRDNGVMATLLWQYWTGNEPLAAVAAGVWLSGALLVLLIVWDRFTPNVEGGY